jgi:antitoxin VapB
MISISPETEQLARLLARRSATTPEQVLKEAVEARAREIGVMPQADRQPTGKPSANRMLEISERFADRPVLDDRSPDDIIGYDKFGVPS